MTRKGEPAHLKTGVEGKDDQGPDRERTLTLAGGGVAPWNSMATLRDLGLSRQTIAAYFRRFPTPLSRPLGTATDCRQ